MIIQAEVIIARNLSLKSMFTDNLLEGPDAALCESVRVSTRSGNHGKPGKSLKKVPCMKKSWYLKKPE